MGKKHHGPPHEEHPDETWLVPYADLLTLLLALFIVLFATAKVDGEKFAQVATAMNNALGGGIGAALGGSIGMGSGAGNTILSGGMGIASGPGSSPTSVMSPAELEGAQLEQAKAAIEAFIESTHKGDAGGGGSSSGTLPADLEIETIVTDQGLLIRIKDNALFASGSAQLYPAGVQFANMVSDMIGTMPQNILVSGHTDNIPINTAQFPSNWELSSARAITLTKYLIAHNPKINPARISAIGCGEYRPIAANSTSEGRSRNRRVEILIQRMYVEGDRAMDTLVNPATPQKDILPE